MNKSVLIIVENAPVPFDTRVWKEATSLRENGYHVTVLCPRGMGYEQGYALIDGIHIYRHPLPKEGHGLSAYLWEYGCALWWELLYTVWIYFRRGFRVIQGCNPPDTIILVALPFKLLGVKYIFDHHDATPELYVSKYGSKGLAYTVQLWLERLTFRFSDIVMSTNHSYKELAVRRGRLSPDDVFVVRNGPDLTKFKQSAPDPSLKRGKKFLIGYVGTMGVQDGLDILLDVAAQLRELGREDIQFICVGGGAELENLGKMVRDKELADFVQFTGRLPDADLLKILSTAEVCVNPDRPCELNDMSTMIKIMEYMALGKPIVQFESKEGRFSADCASLYADHRNQVTDFASKILWLLENPGERERMGRLGRKRVNEELAWEYSVPNLLEAYQRCFEKKSQAARVSPIGVNSGRNMQPAEVAREGADLQNSSLVMKSFYSVKPLIPRSIQIGLRRRRTRWLLQQAQNRWPIWEETALPPTGWPGWPGGKRFALVLTHDVEREVGVRRSLELAGIEEGRGLRSAFGFVPLRYETPESLRRTLVERGFEVMVHDLYHDGKLYRNLGAFSERRGPINEFLQRWETRGFSSGAMHHNLTWISQLNIDYSVSTYDVDPFEPQACGVGRIFPYWVQSPSGEAPGFVEIPYTLPQDFTLFVLLGEESDAIWRRKLDWIAGKGGMALVKTHPDYMVFPNESKRTEGYPVELYIDFLDYVMTRYSNDAWITTPAAVAAYWRELRSGGVGDVNSIAWHDTLCTSCRQAYGAGWLSNFPADSAEASLI